LLAVEGDQVRLRRADGSELTVRMDQLSSADREYLVEAMVPRGVAGIEGLGARPGTVSGPIVCRENPEWSYHLYLPEDFHDGRRWPVWFILSPDGGEGGGELERHIEGAERLGCILALSVESREDFADAWPAVEAMVRDVRKRAPVAEGLAFASGLSGGARMAYLLAGRDSDLAGILACGSGADRQGDDFRGVELRDGIYVYSLIGNLCPSRGEAFRSHADFAPHCRLRLVPGSQDWPDAAYLAEGMTRVLGAGLERYEGEGADPMRAKFARQLWLRALGLLAAEPWEAYYWADYLSRFPAPPEIQANAETLAAQLKENPRVKQALEAEAAIQAFGERHFGTAAEDDPASAEKRKREAERLAEKFRGLPHAELIRGLGDPT